MSYRELRNFTEIMRALGYPRLISMENFRKPNFELVADILYWMVKLYDPETTISDRVEFENERVEFLTGITSLMASKARLKLNSKKLYASDGRAVQELLKLATLLYKATKIATISNDTEEIPPPIKVQDVKVARGLASEITLTGAKLYDLLANESNERIERSRALRFLDQAGAAQEGSKEYAFIERSLRELIENTKQSVDDLRKESEELEVDERRLESNIRKKQEELERTEKRLKTLENVRPQFMDEVEKLEKELQYHYDIYIEKFRNLDYLEHELEKYHKAEEERKLEHEKKLQKMRERLYREEVELLRGSSRDEEKVSKSSSSENRGRSNAPSSNRNRANISVSGSMNMKNDESSVESEEDEDDDNDDEASEEELSVASGNRGNGQFNKRPANGRGNSSNAGSSNGGKANSLNRTTTTTSEEDLVDDDDDDEDMSDDDDDDGTGSEDSDDQF